MCGIFLHLSEDTIDEGNVRGYGDKMSHRGPDSTVEKVLNDFLDIKDEETIAFLKDNGYLKDKKEKKAKEKVAEENN